ncbi:MarR family winged helix-turn-helix transcriptional regulator [Shimia ponticola]|uniref:MarR family winged helix-turn-helix transcriptional regulator n=1 Tax=Shimia ponticola TaxID=2582893 RepID=UPI0011BE3A69|nr:MarR family winged helix-turn-helix transcriptional regulator [Shimia ponticola]
MDIDYRLHDSLGYHLSLTARLQERRLDDGLRSLGLTRTTWCILLAVGVEGLDGPSDIAAFVGIDRTATSRGLRQMEQADLITRTGGQSDGRKRSVVLTPNGETRLRQGAPLARANNEVLATKLEDDEVTELVRLLRKLSKGEPSDLSRF